MHIPRQATRDDIDGCDRTLNTLRQQRDQAGDERERHTYAALIDVWLDYRRELSEALGR